MRFLRHAGFVEASTCSTEFAEERAKLGRMRMVYLSPASIVSSAHPGSDYLTTQRMQRLRYKTIVFSPISARFSNP